MRIAECELWNGNRRHHRGLGCLAAGAPSLTAVCQGGGLISPVRTSTLSDPSPTLRDTAAKDGAPALGRGQALVRLHRFLGVQRVGLDARAHHVDAVERRFGFDLLRVAFIVEAALGDRDHEVLADLVAAELLADPQADLVGSA